MSNFVVPFIEISPITKIKTIVYSKMQVVVEEVFVGQNSAIIKVILWTEIQDELREFIYEINGDDYKNWKDDDYLLLWCKNKIRGEMF